MTILIPHSDSPFSNPPIKMATDAPMDIPTNTSATPVIKHQAKCRSTCLIFQGKYS